MNKKVLSERDICTKFITPALEQAGWDNHLQVREEVSFTDRKIFVRRKTTARGASKLIDYIRYTRLSFPLPLLMPMALFHCVVANNPVQSGV